MNWGSLSRAEREAAYNNRAAADGDGWIARWTEMSSAVRAAHPGHLDLAYGPLERNCWDLFPAADPAAPCLVFIHGGYWQRNTREIFACMTEGVRAHGWAAALPGYTLAPAARLTDIVAEIRTAFDWLAAQGSVHGISGSIIASGWSAGGHLVAMVLDHPCIAAGFAISGVFELGPLRDIEVNDKLQLSDTEIATLSPLRLPPVTKPFTIAYGTQELAALVENSRAFHAHRAAAHCPGPLLPVAGANHFSILEQLRQPAGELTRAVLALA